jgi:hypothetical protein
MASPTSPTQSPEESRREGVVAKLLARHSAELSELSLRSQESRREGVVPKLNALTQEELSELSVRFLEYSVYRGHNRVGNLDVIAELLETAGPFGALLGIPDPIAFFGPEDDKAPQNPPSPKRQKTS